MTRFKGIFVLLALIGAIFAGYSATQASALVGGPDVSCGPGGCGGGGGGGNSCTVGYSYAGYEHFGQPGIGSSAVAIIGDYFDQENNPFPSHVSGFVDVSSNAYDSSGPLRWVQAGINRDQGGSLELYIEKRNSGGIARVWTAPANDSTQYLFYLHHDSSGQWTAYVKTYPGQVLIKSYSVSAAVDYSVFSSESQNTNSTCNIMEFCFWGLTWQTNTMSQVVNWPYWIDPGTNGNDFCGVGP